MDAIQPKKKRESELDEASKQQVRQISLKKEQVDREVRYANLNEDRKRGSWREAMMRVKLPIFREDVEVTWHTFDRSIDSKEHGYIVLFNMKHARFEKIIILLGKSMIMMRCGAAVNAHRANLMMEAVETARQLYEINFSSHAEAIDRFVRMYGSRLGELEDRYKKNLEHLVTSCMKDRRGIEERQSQDEIFVRSLVFSTDQHFQDSYGDIKNKTIGILFFLNQRV